MTTIDIKSRAVCFVVPINECNNHVLDILEEIYEITLVQCIFL